MRRLVLSMSFALVSSNFDSLVHAETVMVPMRDGTKLATEVYLTATGGPKLPVVLVRTVYGRKSDGFGAVVAKRGYVTVMQDTRGYGDSEGEKLRFDADGWGELRDGDDTMK